MAFAGKTTEFKNGNNEIFKIRICNLYLMYVDESGDCGLKKSPTRYFILTGLIVHELRWQTYLDKMIDFRRHLRQKFGLKLREEFHAAKFISDPKEIIRIKRYDRLTMIRMFAKLLSTLTDINLINIVIDKQGKPSDYDVFGIAWKALIQRFDNTISKRNFTGPANPDERDLILPDNTDNKKLMLLLRQMRRYNPIPHIDQYSGGYRDIPLNYIIEDPNFKDSSHAYFIQATDLATFLLYQHFSPNSYIRRKLGKNCFLKLRPIFCTVASRENADGIVKI